MVIVCLLANTQRLGKEDALSGCHVSPAVHKQQVGEMKT